MALREACCFYANHSGVIREIPTKVKENLLTEQEERKQSSSWYESLFNWLSWLTTLVTSLIVSLALLLLVLLRVPCVFSATVCFVQDHMGALSS